MQTQSYELRVLPHANAFLTGSNSAVMVKLAQMNVIMNAIQAQLKTLASVPTNEKVSKRKYYCWSFGSNYNHSSKT